MKFSKLLSEVFYRVMIAGVILEWGYLMYVWYINNQEYFMLASLFLIAFFAALIENEKRVYKG